MLVELRIQNLAVIDDVTVRLGPGLNVLTGETGAGKSIIVGALSLLLGERASADVVRVGAQRASVEGVFHCRSSTIMTWLDEHGFGPGSVTEIILKREIAIEGRNRAWINGSPAPAGLLGELGDMLISIHGQHQHQTLLRGAEQRAVLDAYGGHEDLLERVERAYARVSRLEAEIADLAGRRRDVSQRVDFLRFQLAEIGDADIDPTEESRLEEESRRLSNAEELIALSNACWEAITGGADSASSRLASVRRTLDQLLRIDPSQRELIDLFDSAYYAMEELGLRLETYGSMAEHDPQRLEEVRRRQDLLYRLKTKYGPTLLDVLGAAEAARAELAVTDDAGMRIDVLTVERDQAATELDSLARDLSVRRRAAAADLSRDVSGILTDLGMRDGILEIALHPLDRPGSTGAENVEFLVSLNRGFAPKPLAQVASGGELSRVMLALKTILARQDQVPTLVFDEVDAGIGGRVALQVGEKMRAVAESHQVLSITHLPQIAARAHRHLHVKKVERNGVVATQVEELSSEARALEIARMLGGDPESVTSLAHARELIQKGLGIWIG